MTFASPYEQSLCHTLEGDSLPDGWTIASVGDLVAITSGKYIKRSDYSQTPVQPYPVAGAGGPIGWTDRANFRAPVMTLGRVGAAGTLNLYQSDVWVTDNALVIEPKIRELFRLLAMFFQTVNWADLHTGSSQPLITQSIVKQLRLPLGPLDEQQRIVAKVDKLFTHVNTANGHLSRVPAILKRFRQAVLAAACSGRLTEGWRSLAVSATSLSGNGSFDYAEAEPLFDLPPSWRWVSFESICKDITVGHVGPMAHEYHHTGIPFLRSQNVREFRFDPKGLKYVSRKFHLHLQKSALHPGDVAVVRSGYAGAACVIPDSIPEANCADLVIIRPSTALNPHYACIFINSNAGRAHVDEVKVGIAQSHFNIGSARKTPVPLPPLSEQHEIVRCVGALFSLADTIERKTANASVHVDNLTQSILAKAFRGELVPTEAELARREGREYEPASVLLERIKAERAGESKPSKRVRRSKIALAQRGAHD